MVSKEIVRKKEPFSEYLPVQWVPSGIGQGEEIYSIKRDHGVRAEYRLHNPNDEINENRNYFDKIIIEYRIKETSYALFTIGDLFEVDYAFDQRAEGNIMGDIAERISRRITKYFLKHYSKHGHTGGIFDRRFNPKQRNNFIIAHTDRYVLKIQKYPNLVILDKTGVGKYGYENIKELDGVFDYRYGDRRYIMVLESKLEKVNVDSKHLLECLFNPLSQLFPDAVFTYILFTDRNSIYVKKDLLRLRKVKHHPLTICRGLQSHGIGSLLFTFNETREDFERMKNHLITQYRSAVRLDVQLYGKMVLSDKKIVLFDGGETPRLKLVKDLTAGMWREVKMHHKRSSGQKKNGK